MEIAGSSAASEAVESSNVPISRFPTALAPSSSAFETSLVPDASILLFSRLCLRTIQNVPVAMIRTRTNIMQIIGTTTLVSMPPGGCVGASGLLVVLVDRKRRTVSMETQITNR